MNLISRRGALFQSAAAAGCLGVAGCGTVSFSDPWASASPEPLRDADVFPDNVAEVKTTRVNYAPGVNVQIQRVQDNRITSFEVTGTDPNVVFPPGSYLVEPRRFPNGRDFIRAVTTYSQEIVRGMQQTRGELRIQGTFTGSADSTLIVSNLTYDGQFGDIHDKFPITGKTIEVTLRQGDRLTSNIELATLRAHCIQFLLSEHLPTEIKQDMVSRYSILVSQQPGDQYRFARVHVTLIPRATVS